MIEAKNAKEEPITRTMEVIEAYGRVFLSKEMFDRFESEVINHQKELHKLKISAEKLRESQKTLKEKESVILKERKEWMERREHFINTSKEVLEARQLLSDNEAAIKKLQETNKILVRGINNHVKDRSKEFVKLNPSSHGIKLAVCRRKIQDQECDASSNMQAQRQLSLALKDNLKKYSIAPPAKK
jgi:hypothetical protein